MTMPLNVLIIGASSTIGQAIVKQLRTQHPSWQIHGSYFSHQPEPVAGVHYFQLDVRDQQAIGQLAESLPAVDWLINCVGVLHTEQHRPEKSLSQLEPEFFLHNIEHNTLPTLLLAKHFQNQLRHSKHSLLATLSAKVGSIEDNYLGGWYSYRASKAALNMAIKTIAIEFQRLNPSSRVIAIHPGTTDSPLSEPFQKNVSADKLFSPDQTAERMYQVLINAKPEQSGQFFHWNGTQLPY